MMFITLLIAVAIGSGVARADLGCPPNADTGAARHGVAGDQCFMVHTEELSWEEAENVCKKQDGGSLMQMTSDEEHRVAADFLDAEGLDRMWLGGQKIQEDWHWTDGQSLGAFVPWVGSGPDPDEDLENCVALIHVPPALGDSGWDQKGCATKLMFICQLDASSQECLATADRRVVIEDQTCYVIVQQKTSWFEARVTCIGIGGHLANVESESTQNVLVQDLDGLRSNGFWIGLRKDSWVWNKGEEIVQTYWGSGMPSDGHGCISMYAFTDVIMLWGTGRCQWEFSFACQMAAVEVTPPPSTTTIPTTTTRTVPTTTTTPATTTTSTTTTPKTTTTTTKKTTQTATRNPPDTTTVAGGSTTAIVAKDSGGGGSNDALTGGLVVLAIFLIVILTAVIAFICCYHRRGKVLREQAKKESRLLEQNAQRRNKHAGYNNPAYLEENGEIRESADHPAAAAPRHDVGVARDQNENHPKVISTRASVVDMFTASNCRTEAYVSEALKGSGPETSDSTYQHTPGGASGSATNGNFATASSWKYDADFSRAQSPRRQPPTLGPAVSPQETLPKTVEAGVDMGQSHGHEHHPYEEVQPRAKPQDHVDSVRPRQQVVQHAVNPTTKVRQPNTEIQQKDHPVPDDVTDPTTSNLGDDSLQVLKDYMDDLQHNLDTTVEEDDATLNSEAEANIGPSTSNKESSLSGTQGSDKPDHDDRLHFVLQDLTKQLQMAKEKKKEEHQNSARDSARDQLETPRDSARDRHTARDRDSARDSARGPKSARDYDSQDTSRSTTRGAQPGFLPPIRVTSSNQNRDNKRRKRKDRPSRERKYSQDHVKERRSSVGESSDDHEWRRRRSSTNAHGGGGDSRRRRRHSESGRDERSADDSDDGRQGFTIDDILSGAGFGENKLPASTGQSGGGGGGGGRSERNHEDRRDRRREKRRDYWAEGSRTPGSRDGSRESRDKRCADDSSRDKIRADGNRSRDSSLERSRDRPKPREQRRETPRDRTPRSSRSARATSKNRDSSDDDDDDVIDERQLPRSRGDTRGNGKATSSSQSWARPSGARPEKERMESSGDGGQFGVGMLLESIDHSNAIEI